jgi:hypothetical protein
MKSGSRGTKLKRRSTRHVSERTAIASEFGNSAKIIVPRSWLGRRMILNIFRNIPKSEKQISSEDLFG